jgi:RimJ/RimL family protein N-acetyltransferase
MPPDAKLSVRPLGREDMDGFVAYFAGLNEEDCARMGIELARIPSPAQLRADVEAVIASPAPRTFMLAWCNDDKVIGHSSLKDILPGEFGTMHLHMWCTDLRGHGYGARLFCLSAIDFYERFNLKRIICEPKADNATPNRMLQKVGFPVVLTHVAASSELTPPAEVNRYEILREIAERYLQRRE